MSQSAAPQRDKCSLMCGGATPPPDTSTVMSTVNANDHESKHLVGAGEMGRGEMDGSSLSNRV